MPLKCPKGTKIIYRYKKGTRIRLGGCAKKGKFIKGGVKLRVIGTHDILKNP